MPKRNKKEVKGIAFPITDGKERRTTPTGKAIVASAISSGGGDGEKVTQEKKWRFKYGRHFRAAIQRMASLPPNDLKTMCSGGLAKAHSIMEFVRDGETCSMEAAMQKYDGSFHTGVIRGKGSAKPAVKAVSRGKEYAGEDLVNLLQKLANSGNMDPTAVHAVESVLGHPKWLDLKGKHFVLIGATSEMGPLKFLLQCGATVIAIARHNPKKVARWERLMALAQDSPGTLFFPMREQIDSKDSKALAPSAGADVLCETPELANWLVSLLPEDRPVHIGCYIYLDGKDFVRAAVAMDAIVARVKQARSEAATGICFLETPSHVHVVPARNKTFSEKYRREAPLWQKLLSLFGLLKPLKFYKLEAEPLDGPAYCVDALVNVQGPNYALAKLIQRMRICLHKLEGQPVSANVAPPAATHSVMHVGKVAFALKNAHHFKPNRLFGPDLVSQVMALLLVRDVQDAKSLGQPTVQAHPFAMIAEQAWHGGNWACAYNGDSTGVAAFLVGLVKKYGFVLLLLFLLAAFFLLR